VIPFSAMADLLTIGEVSRRSGVSSSALRFYEERGLITSERAGSRHRRYPRSVLRRIAFIVFAQRVGLSLEEIGDELTKLPPDRAPTRRDWSRLSGKWTARIDQRIAELERLKLGLTECIGCGCLSLDRCKLANPEDRAATRGPGPRYWIGDRPLTPVTSRSRGRRSRPRSGYAPSQPDGAGPTTADR
jgi:MerR family transcriptional regulator, redox-sensitive transcriptional activator SoxR